MAETVYIIKDWCELQANTDLAKTKAWSWVKVPNRHDGGGYRRVAAHEHAADIFAAWVLMLQVASRCPTRGVLATAQGPLDSVDLSAKTGFPARIFDIAFTELQHQKIGWLLAMDWSTYRTAGTPWKTECRETAKTNHEGSTSGEKGISSGYEDGSSGCGPDMSGEVGDSSGLRIRGDIDKRKNKKERKSKRNTRSTSYSSPEPTNASASGAKTSASPSRVFLVFPCIKSPASDKATWDLSEAQVREWQKVFIGIDVAAECRKSLAWISANTSKRKTANGMKKFLVGWLGRTQDRHGGRLLASQPKPLSELESEPGEGCELTPERERILREIAKEGGELAPLKISTGPNDEGVVGEIVPWDDNDNGPEGGPRRAA